MSRAGIIAGIVLIAACVPTMPRDRAYISDEIEGRTGAPVGAEARTDTADPPGVNVGDGVDEDEAVALALWNNAALQATFEDLGFARSDLYRAAALPNPTFALLLPLGPKQLEFTVGWAIDWLWQRPYRVAAAKLDVQRIAEELVARGLDTAQETRRRHAEVVLATTRLALAEKAAETWSQIRRLAVVRQQAGAASLLEVNAVETDARAAQIEAVRRRREGDAAMAFLVETVGASKAFAVVAGDSAAPVTTPIDELVRIALAARPEVRAAEIAIEAAGERQGWETARIFNLIATLDFNAQGTNGAEFGPGLTIGVPIFDQNQAGRAAADAELRQTSWRYIAVRQRVEREVRVAHAALGAATETRAVWPSEVVQPLKKNVKLAQRAYEVGGVSHLVVLDATRRLIEAEQRQAELVADERRARADLSRAVGRMPK